MLAVLLFFNNFNTNIEKASEISRNLILVGDLNEDLLNTYYHNLRDILLIKSMENINVATRNNAILDPIIIYDYMPYLDSGVIDTSNHISDHKAFFLIMPFHYEIQTTYTRPIWIYKRANFESLKQQIRNFDWSCLNEGSLDEACVDFTNIFSWYGKIVYTFKNSTS